MGGDDLRREIEELRARVERLERQLAESEPERFRDSAETAGAPTEVSRPSSAAPPSERAPAAPPESRVDAPQLPDAASGAPGAASPAPVMTPSTTPPAVPPTAPPTAPPTTPPSATPGAKATAFARRPRTVAPPKTRSPLELLIGGKVAAWVGAIVIVGAGALLIQLGWTRMSPIFRCLLIAGCGGLLVVGGEFAIRKISRAASVGLFGAGLGVLYLDAFAAYKPFDLVTQEWAFVLMAAAALVGFACTLHTRFRTIAVLSLIGGYATPILLAGGGGHDLAVLTFITALFAVALALSAVRPVPFRPLRYVALGLHAFVALVWLVSRGQTHWLMGVMFLSIWWAMLVAECVIAAIREQTPRGNAIATLLATAGFATGGCWILGAAPGGAGGPLGAVGPDWLGTFTLLIALLGTAVAFQFGSGLDVLRRRPRGAMDKLAVALWAQSAALVTIAAALQFDGLAQGMSWLVIGVIAIEVGRRLPSRGADAFGVVVWALAVAYLLLAGAMIRFGLGVSDLEDPVAAFGPVDLNKWGALGLLAVALSITAAFRLRIARRGFWRVAPILITATGAFVWLVVASTQVQGLLVTTLWLFAAATLLATHRLGRRQRFLDIGLALIVLSAARWTLVDALAERLGPGWHPSAEMPFLNLRLVLLLAIAACAWWAGVIARGRRLEPAATRRVLEAWAPVAACLLVLVGVSIEIDHAVRRLTPDTLVFAPDLLRALWWTGAWAAGGMAMIFVGRGAQLARMVGTGWVLISMAAVAWLTFDTLAWRIRGPFGGTVFLNLQFAVGALLLGLLLIVVRLVRARSNEALAAEGWLAQVRPLAFGLIGLLGLWLGSFEIDRALIASPRTVQAGLSVWWGLYGSALVVAGFAWRTAIVRYAGLALLTITVLKVVIIDLATVERIWRVVSFFVSGLLLVSVSVLYTKLTPRFLGADETRIPPESPV